MRVELVIRSLYKLSKRHKITAGLYIAGFAWFFQAVFPDVEDSDTVDLFRRALTMNPIDEEEEENETNTTQ